MKREQIEWNLRDAFPQEPQACHDALMHAAYSVREEKKARRVSLRVALLIVLALLVTISVALAVSEWMGWTDYLAQVYSIHITDSMQQEMDATEQRSFQVGPLTLTLRQNLTDGWMALSSIEAYTTDGSPAVCVGDAAFNDPVGAFGENQTAFLGVDPSLTWTQVAAKLDMPLYVVRALMEPAPEFHGGESMEDMLWTQDGRLTYFNMSYLKWATVNETLPVRYYLQVRQYDPATEKQINEWLVEEEDVLSVLPLLAEKDYVPSESIQFDGYRLEKVIGKLYASGAYFTAILTAPEGKEMNLDEIGFLFDAVNLTDEEGNSFPRAFAGGGLYHQQWPTLYRTQSFSLEKLPERIRIKNVDAILQ